jgi:rhodanese-related sulfurtransferase
MISVTTENLDELILNKPGLQIIDIRLNGPFQENHIEGAINIPRPEFIKSIHKIDLSKPMLLYCAIGAKSDEVALFLEKKNKGVEVYTLFGGYDEYLVISSRLRKKQV